MTLCADRITQRVTVRAEIWKHVTEIKNLIPASPENPVELTRDVVEEIILGVDQSFEVASPIVNRIEARIRELNETAPKQIEGA